MEQNPPAPPPPPDATAPPAAPAAPAAQHPIRLHVTDDLQRNRLTVFFRGVLAIPAFIVSSVMSYISRILAVFSWFIALVTGRVPEGLRNFGAFALRFEQQTLAYAFLLTGKYPNFNVGVES